MPGGVGYDLKLATCSNSGVEVLVLRFSKVNAIDKLFVPTEIHDDEMVVVDCGGQGMR